MPSSACKKKLSRRSDFIFEDENNQFMGTLANSPHNVFFFNDTANTEIYTLSLHDALPISSAGVMTKTLFAGRRVDRQGGVLFIAAEGQDEVRVRLAGLALDKVAPFAEQ